VTGVRRDLIVVGASAGGVEALQTLVAALPLDLPATVLVVLHLPSAGVDALGAILNRAGPVAARRAEHGDILETGRILVARPDHHLLVVDGAVALSRGPRENGHRPAVDVLFRTAARARGPRVASVVLSGALDDGAAGSVAVVGRGGVALAQDPNEALHSGMPVACVRASGAQALPVKDLADRLVELAVTEADVTALAAPSDLTERETAMAGMDSESIESVDRPGVPSGFSCPDCHGVLFHLEEGRMQRFRCRVGHAWSMDSLLAQHGQAVEGALWMALRSLEERAALSSHLSEHARQRSRPITAAQFAEQATEARSAAELIRRMLVDSPDTRLTSDLAEEPARAD